MITFKYTAIDPASNERIKSEIQADSELSAAKAIKKQGFAPIEVTPIDKESNLLGKIFQRISTKDRVLFSRQLATLINAGLPLVQSLHNVMEQTSNKKFKLIIAQVIGDVEGGQPLSKALAAFPQVFDEVFINLVAAGEVSGTLDVSLQRVADQQEKQAEIISKVRGAMAYPSVVVMVMVLVVGFMVLNVLPQVEKIYQDIPNVKLPFITRILLSVSNFTRKYWWVELVVLSILVFFTTRWARTLGGKTAIDAVKLRAPLFGQLFFKMYMARFARIGGTMVASGVPLLQTLSVTAKAVNNVHIAASIQKASEKVKGGKALSEALTDDPYFLPLVPNMLKIGEQSGQLEQMMVKTADYYEKEVDNQIKTISTIIEPFLMILLGAAALIIVAAVLLPIYGLAGQEGGLAR